MFRSTRLVLIVLAPLVPVLVHAQQPAPTAPAAKAPMTNEQKIASAVTAGPRNITAHAEIRDWGADMMAPTTQLRATADRGDQESALCGPAK